MPVNNNVEPSSILQLIGSMKDVLLGVIGGVVAYFLRYEEKKKLDDTHTFSWITLVFNMLLGGYAAYLFGTLIPETAGYKDFVIGSIGVASYPILTWVERNALGVLLKKANLKMKLINKYEINKYFYDVEDESILKMLDYLIEIYGIGSVLDKTNGVLNSELTIIDVIKIRKELSDVNRKN